MSPERKDVVARIFPEVEPEELDAICSCLDELPENTQRHLIENIFSMVDLRRKLKTM